MKRGPVFQSAKDIAGIGVMTGLLIAAQYVLSMIAGIEIVTALFSAYCFVFGIRRGMMVGICFSLLRCVLFGVFPAVIVLYLIYYTLFSLSFGVLGRVTKGFSAFKCLITAVACAGILTPCFTLLDDLFSPLITGVRFLPYFYASLPVLAVQTCCAIVTVSLSFLPLSRAMSQLRSGTRKENLDID